MPKGIPMTAAAALTPAKAHPVVRLAERRGVGASDSRAVTAPVATGVAMALLAGKPSTVTDGAGTTAGGRPVTTAVLVSSLGVAGRAAVAASA